MTKTHRIELKINELERRAIYIRAQIAEIDRRAERIKARLTTFEAIAKLEGAK